MSTNTEEEPGDMLKVKAMMDVFLLVDKACSDSAGLFSRREERRLDELNERIKFYHLCFKKYCEDQPSKKRNSNFNFDNMVPRFSKILRDFILTHQWPQALKWVHALTVEIQNTDSTIWKAGLACLIQNGSQRLIHTFVKQLQVLKNLTCVEVLLDYLLHLLTLGDLLTAKELIMDLKQSDKYFQNILSNERRKEAHRLFYAYQGLVLYLEWRAMIMDENSDMAESDVDVFLTPSKSRADDMESSKAIADKAIEYLTSVRDFPGVWDIFLFKVVMIHEHYDNLDDARTLLKSYRENNPSNPNAHKNLYEFELRHDGDQDLMRQCLQDLVKLDPCNSLAITLFKSLEQTNPETVSVLFNYLDYDHCKHDSLVWKLFAEHLVQIHEEGNSSTLDMIEKCWDVRKDWWPSFVLECDENQQNESTIHKEIMDRPTSSLAQYRKTVAGVLHEIEKGWLQRFKVRNGIAQRVVSGESAAVQQDTVADWRSTILQELLQEYEAKNIYNADETGLFYRCLPDKTLAYKTESVHGHKQPKDCLTVLIATNMDGTDKLPLLVIGKAKKPHCFRGVATLPCDYRHNKKAWMLSGIFEEWVRKLDRKMVCGGRNIVLLVDNCPAHPVMEGLLAIELVFLPPNTTSVLQPCDQGIIQAFKRHYRKSVLRQYLAHLDSGGSTSDMKITVIDALFTMRSAWKDVSQSTIQSCWRHAGFTFTTPVDVSEQQELPSSDNLFERLATLLPTTQLCTPEEYDQVDQDSQTSAALTDQEIVEQVKATGSVPSPCDEDEEEDEPEQLEHHVQAVVSSSEAQKCLQTVRNFFMLNGGEGFFDSLGDMEKHILD